MRRVASRSRDVRRVALVLGLGALASIGCSLVIDTDGLSGGDGGGSEDANASDGANDTSPADGAGDAGMADASTCDGTFCEDFDKTPLGTTWTSVLVDDGMSLGLDPRALSPPNALRAGIDAGAANMTRHAWLDRALGVGSKMRCEVSVNVLVLPKDGTYPDIFALSARGQDVTDYMILVGLTHTGSGSIRDDVFLSDGGCDCPRHQQNIGTLPTGSWVRLAIETDFVSMKVTRDGAIVASGAFGGFAPVGPLHAMVGLRVYDTDTSTQVLYDDLVCSISQ